MEYGAFLMAQLLQEISEPSANLEYDYLYEEANRIYKDFLASEYNDNNRSEYDCINEFLRARIKENIGKVQSIANEVDEYISFYTSDEKERFKMRLVMGEWIATKHLI